MGGRAHYGRRDQRRRLPRALPLSVLGLAPVIPVVVLHDAADAVPLARALVGGGLPAIEVTLRTPAALDAIRAVSQEVPEAVIGAGTLLTPGQVEAALVAGSRFLVSPGWSPRLLGAMKDSGVPFLPGVSTASEVVTLLDEGVTEMKFFPAEAAGGTPYLHSLASPSPRPASARPAGSAWRRRRPIWRCPTSAASAAPGCCRPTRWPRRTGTGCVNSPRKRRHWRPEAVRTRKGPAPRKTEVPGPYAYGGDTAGVRDAPLPQM